MSHTPNDWLEAYREVMQNHDTAKQQFISMQLTWNGLHADRVEWARLKRDIRVNHSFDGFK